MEEPLGRFIPGGGGIAAFDQTQAKAIASLRNARNFFLVAETHEDGTDYYCCVQNDLPHDVASFLVSKVNKYARGLWEEAVAERRRLDGSDEEA